MNLVSSSYDMMLKICETLELSGEYVVLKQMLHYEEIERQKINIEMKVNNHETEQHVDNVMRDLLSFVEYLIENAYYAEAKSKCVQGRKSLSQRHQRDKRTPFWAWSKQVFGFFEQFLDEDYKECVKKFDNSLNAFEKLPSPVSHDTSCLMMNAFLHCLTSCYDSLSQHNYDDLMKKFNVLKFKHLKRGTNSYWEFTSKIIFFEADFMPGDYEVDTESWKSKFQKFNKDAAEFGISEDSQLLAYSRHGIARLYFWKEDDMIAALKHMTIVQEHRQLAYKKHDIRYLQATLDLFMFFVFNCDFQKAQTYVLDIENGLLDYNKYHNCVCPVSYYRMACKYHILCAMIPTPNFRQKISLVDAEKQRKAHYDCAEFCKTKVMDARKKHILNIELYYLFAMYADRCGNLQKRKVELKKCATYGNKKYLHSNTLVMQKALKALVTWESANNCFVILSLPKFDV